MGGASGVASNNTRETGCGSTPSSFSARTTARLRRSTLARQPSYNRYVVAALSERGVTRTLCPEASPSPNTAPAVTVVLVASSQTAQPDSCSPRVGAIVAGAPGMPTSGPPFELLIADMLTASGLAGAPAISRADARFNTG